MQISIFGLGYVGCISLGCLAKNGHTVIGVDVADTKVNLINQGKPTIIEKDIDEIIREEFLLGKISATKDFNKAVAETDVSIICVGTPSSQNGHLDLSHIFDTARQIGSALKNKNTFHVIAIRSTVMPGTNARVGKIIEETSGKSRDTDFTVVSNPEFLREGSSVYDYYNPAITVIGSDNDKGTAIMSEIYKDVNAPIEVTEIEVAEIIKYINNSFHALKIVFANEVGNICKKLNIDSHKVMDLFCKDDHLNISSYYFKPGFAYGGSCLPKDLKGLNTLAHDFYLSAPVINSIEESNNYQKKIVVDLLLSLRKKNISVLGLSFKSGTDDLRYSPAVDVVEQLIGKGCNIRVFDENVNISKLTGTNKDYIDAYLPHLSELISDDLEQVTNFGEVVLITYKDKRFAPLIDAAPDKIFVDLVRSVNRSTGGNYIGLCW